jgi:hypothetical protein
VKSVRLGVGGKTSLGYEFLRQFEGSVVHQQLGKSSNNV